MLCFFINNENSASCRLNYTTYGTSLLPFDVVSFLPYCWAVSILMSCMSAKVFAWDICLIIAQEWWYYKSGSCKPVKVLDALWRIKFRISPSVRAAFDRNTDLSYSMKPAASDALLHITTNAFNAWLRPSFMLWSYSTSRAGSFLTPNRLLNTNFTCSYDVSSVYSSLSSANCS